MEFEKACSEVDFILDNLEEKYKSQIPKDMINFFKFNKDIFYQVNIDMSKSFNEQNLLEETKAFLYMLKEDYFSMEEEQTETIGFDVLSEGKNIEMFDYKEEAEKVTEKSIVAYSNNPIMVLIRKIKNFFKK